MTKNGNAPLPPPVVSSPSSEPEEGFDPLTHFQIMPVSADGDFNIVWIDDLSFTAEPTVLPPGWNTNVHPVGDWHVSLTDTAAVPDVGIQLIVYCQNP